jgi:hypothetical protein
MCREIGLCPSATSCSNCLFGMKVPGYVCCVSIPIILINYLFNLYNAGHCASLAVQLDRSHPRGLFVAAIIPGIVHTLLNLILLVFRQVACVERVSRSACCCPRRLREHVPADRRGRWKRPGQRRVPAGGLLFWECFGSFFFVFLWKLKQNSAAPHLFACPPCRSASRWRCARLALSRACFKAKCRPASVVCN